jgi:tetratricopeptide (TPR) repeat protein
MKCLVTLVFCLFVLQAEPALAQRWTLLTSEKLTVIGDESPRALRDIAIQIEQFRAVIGSVFTDAGRGPSLPTVVYVFSTDARLREYLPIVDGKVASVAGMMSRDGEVNRILMSTEAFERSSEIAFHEYTHLLIGNTGRSFPVWLNEGLSEYFSSYNMRDGGKAAEIGRPLASSILFLRERWLPLADMLAVESSLYHDSPQRRVFYPQAWALVHYVITQMPKGTEAINTYMKLLDAGQSSEAAFAEAFGLTIQAMDNQLRQYVRRQIFQLQRFTFTEKMVAKAPSTPRTLSAAEADTWLGDLQRAERRLPEATTRIESAVAREPELAIAQLALGRLRVAQDRHDEARQALARAASLAPDDYNVQWGNVAARMRMGITEPTPDFVDALRRVARLRPDSAEAQALFGRVAMRNGATRGEAQAALETAIKLAPGRLDYRLRYAELLLTANQVAPARSLLRGIASVTGDPETSQQAAQHLARLDAIDKANADRAAAAAAMGTTRPTDLRPPDTTAAPGTPVGPVRLVTGEVLSTAAALQQQRNRRLSFQLRAVGASEQRAFGRLIQVECRAGGEVRFHLMSDGRRIVAIGKDMSAVELTQYRDNSESTMRCGARTPADAVFLTWRADTKIEGIAGTAVAVEFMPDDFVP